MPITHEEARRLIQSNMDNALNAQEKNTLSAHLKDCVECCLYEEEIREVEEILLPVMKGHWNLQPAPLSIDALHLKTKAKLQTSIILTTRTAAVSLMLLAFLFSAWQFTRSGKQAPTRLPVSVLPNPTPSVQSTLTNAVSKNCEGIVYTVQENDTLESIARQFSVSKEEITRANHMKMETIISATRIIIPTCRSTPTGTSNATTQTTTFTPAMRPTTLTPDG